MLGMAGVGDYLEEPLVLRSAPDILGRTGSRACDAGGTARCGIEGNQPLEGYAVLPVVTEIIDVEEALIERMAEITKPNLSLIK